MITHLIAVLDETDERHDYAMAFLPIPYELGECE